MCRCCQEASKTAKGKQDWLFGHVKPDNGHCLELLTKYFIGQMSGILVSKVLYVDKDMALKVLSQRRKLSFLSSQKCYFWINIVGSFPGPWSEL